MFTSDSNDLQRTSPERQGIASSAILQLVEELESEIHEIHSFMLLRHNNVVAEGWWSPYGPEYPHALFSVSKSFTSAAVGMAVTEGRFFIDDPVLSFFPDEAPTEVSDYLATMSVRHLLTMSTGHAADTLSYLVGRSDGDWIKGFLDAPILYEPGTHFAYDSGATYMLSAIVQKRTGMRLLDYLLPRLFEPLGIKNPTWLESPQGIAVGGYGLSITTEDLARFGQLYLQRGKWGGRQILPEAWVEASTLLQISNGSSVLQNDSVQGYGYQFWLSRHNAYRASGVFGQYCIVMPDQDAVIAVTGGIDIFDDQQVLDLVWKQLLPAMHMEPLPDDAAAQDALNKKLAALTMQPVQGHAKTPISPQVSGQMFAVDVNELKLETITMEFTDSGCTIRLKTAWGVEMISCGYGMWQQSHTTLFNDTRWFSNRPTPVVASGAWTAEDSFTMIVRLYETPFVYTLVYYFVSLEMMVDVQVNVSLDVSRPLVLTAHL